MVLKIRENSENLNGRIRFPFLKFFPEFSKGAQRQLCDPVHEACLCGKIPKNPGKKTEQKFVSG